MKKIIDSKVALIDKEGIIHVMGDANEAGSHAAYFIDYINNYYFNVDTNNLTIGSPRDRFGYILGRFGNVIYFNDVDSCMMYFPDELTEKQISVLNSLDLGNQRVVLFYNLQDFGTFVCSETIGLEDDEHMNIHEVMNEYLSHDYKFTR